MEKQWKNNAKIYNNDILKSLGIHITEYTPKNLPNQNIKQIQSATNSGFGIQLSEYDIKNHLFGSDKIFLIQDNDDNILGFSSIKFLGNFIYRFGSVVHKDYQKKGIYTQLNNHVSGIQGFLRTQNKNIIKSFQKLGYNTLVGELAYDFMKQKVDPEDINNFFAHLDGGINRFDNGIFKAVYGGPMGSEENVDFIDKTIHPKFDHTQGDALLVTYYK